MRFRVNCVTRQRCAGLARFESICWAPHHSRVIASTGVCATCATCASQAHRFQSCRQHGRNMFHPPPPMKRNSSALSLCSLLLFHSCGWTKPSQRAMRGIMAALRDFPANRTQLERRRRRIDAPPYSMPAPSGRWRSGRGGGGKEEGKS